MAPSPSTPVAPPSAPAAPADKAPRFAGRFQILRLLGSGTVGEVHLALDHERRQPVALKRLRLGGADTDAQQQENRQRFLSEAQTAAALDHPDIVAVLDAGEHEGSAWLAMEPLPGCELSRYARASRLLPEPLVLGIGQRLAGALGHAHDRGLLHRDIKPANVMVDLPTRMVKLLDFGLARLADGQHTRTGVVLGTPAYMAPEQLAGGEPDARADVYSLGVLLFQLLTGRLPHEAASLGDLLRQVAQQPAPDLRSVRPGSSETLARLLARALHKDAAQRHASGWQMAAELRRIMDESMPSPWRISAMGDARHNLDLGDEGGAYGAPSP